MRKSRSLMFYRHGRFVYSLMLALSVDHRGFPGIRSSIVGLARAQNASSSGVIFMGCGFLQCRAAFLHVLPHFILMQPYWIRIAPNEFVRVHAVNLLRLRTRFILP